MITFYISLIKIKLVIIVLNNLKMPFSRFYSSSYRMVQMFWIFFHSNANKYQWWRRLSWEAIKHTSFVKRKKNISSITVNVKCSPLVYIKINFLTKTRYRNFQWYRNIFLNMIKMFNYFNKFPKFTCSVNKKLFPFFRLFKKNIKAEKKRIWDTCSMLFTSHVTWNLLKYISIS